MEAAGALSTRGNDLAQGTQKDDAITQGEMVKGRMGERMGSTKT